MEREPLKSLRRAMSQVELPPLLVAAAQDIPAPDLLRPQWAPSYSLDPLAAPNPHGGMTARQRREAQAALERALLPLWSGHETPTFAPHSDPAAWLAGINFLHPNATAAHREMYLSELGLAHAKTAANSSPVRSTTFRTAIIGAGLSGLIAASHLEAAGHPYTVFEARDQVGGVWHANRYPGCRLDTSNFGYSLSYRQKPDWSHYYLPGPEVQQYIREATTDLVDPANIRLNTCVTSMEYDADHDTWHVSSRDGCGNIHTESYRMVIAATGQLNKPKYPDIPGMNRFKGVLSHSAEYDAALTLEEKRVAIVGTGASAFQIAPQIVKDVSALTIYQRTPPYTLRTDRYQQEIEQEHARLFELLPSYHRWYRLHQVIATAESRDDIVTAVPNWPHTSSVSPGSEAVKRMHHQRVMDEYRDRPDLAAKLAPRYPPFSKRMLRDDGAWSRTLKDSKTELVVDEIATFVDDGLTTVTGENRSHDVVILATGFITGRFLQDIKVRGLDGADLQEAWSARPGAYLGITVPKFPNMFILYGPNTNLVTNSSITFMSESATAHIMELYRKALETGANRIMVREQPYGEYLSEMDRRNSRRAWGAAHVNTWYKSADGVVTQNWPGKLEEYFHRTRNINWDHYTFT